MFFQKVTIIKVRDFWDRRPCNIRHSNAKIGSKKYFDEVEKRKYFVEPHIPQFADFYRWKGKKVLEIGCGIGTDTINFARAGAFVTAVELSKKSLEIAKKRAKVFKFQSKIKFYLANAEELSTVVPVKPYDLIYSFGVIHHSPNPEKIINEIKKYCNVNTVVKVMIYYRYSWKVLWILFKYGKGAFWKLDRLIAENSEAATGSPVTYVFSKEEAIRLLNDFEIIDLKVDHIFPYIISDYIKYKYKIVWYFRILPKNIFRWLETNFGWHLLITAKLIG
ncbi:MAG: class I SAM-dependent methyltransferase [Candidatus Daviesbacteria bacterium]|nr:class I SAM-dependent methyltransferase [Candidatus Daviesbacteria bacterium]